MQRGELIQTTVLGDGFACLSVFKLLGGANGEKYPDVEKYKIEKMEPVKYDYQWPRLVGKNVFLTLYTVI